VNLSLQLVRHNDLLKYLLVDTWSAMVPGMLIVVDLITHILMACRIVSAMTT
jgi:hypothetical protein